MGRHVALLRGINVAGHRPVSMADLRTLFTDLGFTDVETLLQSGNVVFGAPRASGAALEGRLEAEAEKRLDLVTRFIVRSAAQWGALVAANPFPEMAQKDPGHLITVCLREAPAAGRLDALRAAIRGREVVEIRGRELYAYYPDGVGRSKLTHVLLESRLGVQGTGRNWNTVQKLLAKLA